MDTPTHSKKSAPSSKKIKNIDQQIVSILRTVLERCKKEKSSNCLQVPLEDCYERVSFYTAFPKMFVYHVVDDNCFEEDGFDDNDHIILMECMNIFLAGGLYLRFYDLYEEFLKCRRQMKIDSKYTPDLKTFERKVYSYGYAYKKNLKSPSLILVEDPKLKFQRFNYLYKIKQYREKNRHIYYVDEKQIFKFPFKSPLKSYQAGKSKSVEGLIFFHIISVDGYEYGIFLSPESDSSLEDLFKKWMLDIVLYSIKPSSVIVMADNIIHGSLPTKSITRYHSKKRMIQWLHENNIPCDPSMNKPTLYELIEKCNINSKDYDIDRVFKLHGHNVLRLPTTFPSLNPTSCLWNHINKKFNQFDTNVVQTKNKLSAYISLLESQTWEQFVTMTKDKENRIFEIDLLTEDMLENNYELDEKCFYETSSNFNIEDILEDK